MFPGRVEEVAAVVAQAAAAGVPVLPWGGGTGMAVGEPPPRAGIVLGMRRLARVIEHEPGDLTVTAEAGLTVDGLQETLRARGQWLSLDPPDGARATVGGVIAANAAGPRRQLYGTVRDLLIGLTVVTAAGEVVRGGGKVVKNVAGYDLPKLFVGSWGTLGVVVDATFKLRPRPDDERLIAVRFDRLKDCWRRCPGAAGRRPHPQRRRDPRPRLGGGARPGRHCHARRRLRRAARADRVAGRRAGDAALPAGRPRPRAAAGRRRGRGWPRSAATRSPSRRR